MSLVAHETVAQREARAHVATHAQRLLVAAVAWGAFAFGAVYPWAYWPLVIAIQLVSIGALVDRLPTETRRLHLRPLIASMIAVCAAAILQLLPLPPAWLAKLSPHASAAIATLDPVAAANRWLPHPLSIWPADTLIALAILASIGFLVIGSARLFSLRGVRDFGEALAALGVLVALVGIIQQPLSTGKIYGFWSPEQIGGLVYGPFVNRNHYAGWMLLALPMTLGLISAGVARGMAGVRPTFRDRLLWFSSPAANRLVLLTGAAAVMAVALVLTMSRSGISAFALAIAITTAQVLRHQKGVVRRIVGAGLIVGVALGAITWIGVDVVSQRFRDANWRELDKRKGAWSDAWSIASMYPLTGTGLNTYDRATLLYQKHDLAFHYSQAHNDYLQLAAEGGALLVVPAFVCLVAFGLAVRRRFAEETSVTAYWIRTGAVTSIVAMALQEVAEFSLQMPGNAVLFACVCGVALHRAPPRKDHR